MGSVRVEIGGNPIGQAWDGGSIVALDDLYIDWGRESHYDVIPPSKLTLRVIDPDGLWSSNPSRYGERIHVYNGERRVFVGDIDQLRSREVTLRDPDSGDAVQVWSTTILAVDPLAALAKIIPKGPGPDPAMDEVDRAAELEWYGPNFWRRQHPSYRVEDVYASDSRVREAVPGGMVGGYTGTGVRSIPVPMGASALELIRRAHALPGPGATYFQPATQRVLRTWPAAAGALSLLYTGGRVVLRGSGETAVVPGSLFELESKSPELESSFSRSINQLRLTVGRNWLDKFEPGSPAGTYRVDRFDTVDYIVTVEDNPSRLVQNTLDFDVELWYYTTAYNGTSRNVPGAALDDYLSNPSTEDGATLDNIRKLNGRIGLPPLSINLREPATEAALGPDLYETLTKPNQEQQTAVYFAGLRYSGLRYVGPHFQLLGGRFGYSDGGWYASGLNFQPAVPLSSLDPVTISSWITNVNPSFSQIDPSISFADLENVAVGAA